MTNGTVQERALRMFRYWRDGDLDTQRMIEDATINGHAVAANEEGRMVQELATRFIKAHPRYAPQRAINQQDIEAARR